MWAQQYHLQQNQQYQPQQYQSYNNNQYYQNFQEQQTTSSPVVNPKGSIDFVVTQIQTLANQIHTLEVDGETAGLQIADHAINTLDSMKSQLDNDTIPNVDRLVDIAKQRFHDWPVTELIVMIVIGVILVIITLIFLFILFGQRVTVYRHRQRVAKSDVENI